MNYASENENNKMMLGKFGDEIENVFEKRQFLSVTMYFFEENVKKTHFWV